MTMPITALWLSTASMYDLNAFIDPPESWEVIHALGINGRGDIVAVANDGSEDRIVRLQHKWKPRV